MHDCRVWRVEAARQVWSAGLCEFHRRRAVTMTPAHCATALRVWWPYGLAFELVATSVSYTVWSTDFLDEQHRRLERCAKALLTSVAAVSSKKYSA